MTIFKKIKNLILDAEKSENFYRFLFARIFLTKLSFIFKHFSIKRKNYKLKLSPLSYPLTFFIKEPSKMTLFDKEEELLKLLMPNEGWFVDIGANIGHISIYLKKSLPNIKCLSVEANPNTYKHLKKNIMLNNLDIKTKNCLIGEHNNQKKKFQDSFSDDGNSVALENFEDKDLYIVDNNNELIEMDTKKLDTICEEFNIKNIDLLKVDTEGYEYFVLKGGEEILQKTNIIYFECWDRLNKKYNYNSELLISYLQNKKFNIYTFDINYILLNKLNYKNLTKIDSDFKSEVNQNLLAIKNDYMH